MPAPVPKSVTFKLVSITRREDGRWVVKKWSPAKVFGSRAAAERYVELMLELIEVRRLIKSLEGSKSPTMTEDLKKLSAAREHLIQQINDVLVENGNEAILPDFDPAAIKPKFKIFPDDTPPL